MVKSFLGNSPTLPRNCPVPWISLMDINAFHILWNKCLLDICCFTCFQLKDTWLLKDLMGLKHEKIPRTTNSFHWFLSEKCTDFCFPWISLCFNPPLKLLCSHVCSAGFCCFHHIWSHFFFSSSFYCLLFEPPPSHSTPLFSRPLHSAVGMQRTLTAFSPAILQSWPLPTRKWFLTWTRTSSRASLTLIQNSQLRNSSSL